MNQSLRLRLGLVLGLAAMLAGCQGPCSKIESINAPTLAANGVDLSTYVAVGTSLSAGYESGGVVNRHQVHSFPALFATQIGKTVQADGQGTFTMPAMSGDGVPPLMRIRSLSPLVIDSLGRITGGPMNFGQATAYHDMGIPGALMIDLVDTVFYHSAPPQIRTNFTYFDLITRTRGTVLQQALSLAPSIMSLEYGANEILGPTTQAGSAPGGTSNVSHAQLMTAALNAIHATLPNTKVAVFNIPDVTSIPFFTTFPAFTVSTTTGQPLPLVGASGPLQLGDLVLLRAGSLIAAGTGIPTGGFNYVNPPAGSNGQPLPENLILRLSEVAATQTEIDEMNAVVDSVALRPFVCRVDIHDFFAGIAANGYALGGTTYTTDFVTGGLFSLDGVHPNDLGYALMANQLIDAVNGRFGSAIPRVNPAAYATPNASRARRADEPKTYPLAIEGLESRLNMLFGRGQ